MSDEKNEHSGEAYRPDIPDWLTETHIGPGEAEMLAQEGSALASVEPEVVAAVPRRRYIYTSSEWTRVSPRTFSCRVTVRSAKGEFSGTYEGASVPGARAEIAARATLEALNIAEGGEITLALKGARVLRVFEGPIVVVGVYGMNGGTTTLLGACIVENSVEQSAVLATLQAADRWLAYQSKQREE